MWKSAGRSDAHSQGTTLTSWAEQIWVCKCVLYNIRKIWPLFGDATFLLQIPPCQASGLYFSAWCNLSVLLYIVYVSGLLLLFASRSLSQLLFGPEAGSPWTFYHIYVVGRQPLSHSHTLGCNLELPINLWCLFVSSNRTQGLLAVRQHNRSENVNADVFPTTDTSQWDAQLVAG